MSRLRLGMIGCGDIARYVAFFAQINPRIRIAAACDATQAGAEVFARRHGIPAAYSDYRQMLAEAALDAVYIAVPHHLHAPMIAAAVEAGRHVLVEKPITRTLAEGRQAAALAEQAGVKLGVNYQYRYDSGCYALAMAVRGGALGRVHYVRGNLAWHRTPDYFMQGVWRGSEECAGGGTLITQGSHILDVMLWAANQPPVSALGVTAQRHFPDVEVEDLAAGLVELADGSMIEITSSMIAVSEQPLRIELFGERGVAIYTDKPFPRVRFQGVSPRPCRPPVPGIHALMRSLEAFRRWVMDDVSYLCSAREALPALAAVEAIYRSAQSGCKEPVDL